MGTGVFNETLGLKIVSNAPSLCNHTNCFNLFACFWFASYSFYVWHSSWGKTAKLSGLNPSYLIILAAFICGSIGIFLPEILGLGTNEMNNIFADKYGLLFLFIILLGKILMTSLCIGLVFLEVFLLRSLRWGCREGLIAKLFYFWIFSIFASTCISWTAAVGA